MHAAVPQLRQPALRLPLLAWAAFAFTLNLTFTPQNALAQRPEPPRLALDFRGPVGKTFTLGFLHDGRRFFAAGENKVLQFYDIVDRRIIPAAPIRWEFARGALGEINAAAITADSHQGLLAGSSARGAGGDILLVDTGTQAVLDVLSANTEVVSLIANRDASVIAASNRLGGVLLFKRGSDAKFIRSELHPTASDNPADNSPLRTFHPLAFASNKYLLCFLPIGSADNQTDQLTAFDLDNVGTVKTLESFTQLATSLAVSPDGQLIFAGDADGGLVIRRNGLDSPAETASLNQLLQIPADTLLTSAASRSPPMPHSSRHSVISNPIPKPVPLTAPKPAPFLPCSMLPRSNCLTASNSPDSKPVVQPPSPRIRHACSHTTTTSKNSSSGNSTKTQSTPLPSPTTACHSHCSSHPLQPKAADASSTQPASPPAILPPTPATNSSCRTPPISRPSSPSVTPALKNPKASPPTHPTRLPFQQTTPIPLPPAGP